MNHIRFADPQIEISPDDLEAVSRTALTLARQPGLNRGMIPREPAETFPYKPSVKPVMTVIAGPNGSGKTTFVTAAQSHGWLSGSEYVNPDNIAQDLFGSWNSHEAVLRAAQHAGELRYAYLHGKRSFTFETVLSGSDKLTFFREARSHGFFIRLIFIGTHCPTVNAARVARRVMQGGHDVPIPKIISRHAKSIANLAALMPLVDRAHVFDNSVDFEVQTLLWSMADTWLQPSALRLDCWSQPAKRQLSVA